MRYMVEQGQTTESRQKILCCGILVGEPLHQVDLGADGEGAAGGSGGYGLVMKSVEPEASAASTTGMGHSGCTMTRTPG